jgi:hypothetical protein
MAYQPATAIVKITVKIATRRRYIINCAALVSITIDLSRWILYFFLFKSVDHLLYARLNGVYHGSILPGPLITGDVFCIFFCTTATCCHNTPGKDDILHGRNLMFTGKMDKFF